MSECCSWYEGDPILEEYHDHEWCLVNHDDRFQFEMLCLEGASVGHDSLFYRYSDAFVTTLVSKDRVLAHNTVAAIY